jgi:transglutaminase-like putative cysteine protease
MRHRIVHDTFYTYDAPVHESVMEVRLHPCSNERQRCEHFALHITPKTTIHRYIDAAHNTINHFQIPGALTTLHVRAESTVDVFPVASLPAYLAHTDWDAYRPLQQTALLDYTIGSTYVRQSALLAAFLAENGIDRSRDPLTTIRHITRVLYETIRYTPESTTIDTTIDEVLVQRTGVCQDISHLMIAICRRLEIPARYVSGYLYHRVHDHDRSQTDATHAWVDVWVPGHGWVGFDPTNHIEATERHIVVATGRDYADVSPTRGVYRGVAHEQLAVSVRINDDTTTAPPIVSTRPAWPSAEAQQQQQQQ